MPVEWVEITHPDQEGSRAWVNRKAFEDTHKDKGFVLVKKEKPKKQTKKETE